MIELHPVIQTVSMPWDNISTNALLGLACTLSVLLLQKFYTDFMLSIRLTPHQVHIHARLVELWRWMWKLIVCYHPCLLLTSSLLWMKYGMLTQAYILVAIPSFISAGSHLIQIAHTCVRGSERDNIVLSRILMLLFAIILPMLYGDREGMERPVWYKPNQYSYESIFSRVTMLLSVLNGGLWILCLLPSPLPTASMHALTSLLDLVVSGSCVLTILHTNLSEHGIIISWSSWSMLVCMIRTVASIWLSGHYGCRTLHWLKNIPASIRYTPKGGAKHESMPISGPPTLPRHIRDRWSSAWRRGGSRRHRK